MVSWGLVATVKAPEEKLLAFIAHHLSLGAAQLWIYFDDPDDAAFAVVSRLPRVIAIRCTDTYWRACGGRSERHQNRQTRNARDAILGCDLNWLGHLDVDEFLHAPRPVADILADQPADTVALRMEPFEAMDDPDLEDDIYTARQFRGPLRDTHRGLRVPVLGLYRSIMPKGNLSHAVGKVFCRPSVPRIDMRMHNVYLDGKAQEGSFHAEMRVLHFHTQGYAAWRQALPFRLERGAYQYHPELRAHLAAATDAITRHLFDVTQVLTPENAELLETHGRLITADLGLRRQVAALLAGRMA